MPETEKYTDWQCPAFTDTPERRNEWCTEAVSDGDRWVEAQNIQDADLDILKAGGGKLKTSNSKADIRKFVETISDVREIATFGGAGGPDSERAIEAYNRLSKYIYHDSHFLRQTRKALQWAVCLKRGYIWPRYVRTDFGWGPGKFIFQDLGPRQVLPVQLPADNDIQGAYANTIADCLGIAEAHARFPRHQEQLNPISRIKISSNSQVRRYEFWDRWKFGQNSNDWDNRYCEIRYHFVRDLAINHSGKELLMGDEGASWSYKVPSVGQLIVRTNPLNGMAESRIALESDCRIYPQLRLMITNPGMSVPLYDGPAFDWHGMMPPVPFDVDDWPWMAIGYSLIQDIIGVERAERGFIDLMYQVLRVRMNPPVGYDLNAGVPDEKIKHFNWLDESGTKFGVDGDVRKAVQSMLPDTTNVTADDFKFLELCERIRQKTLGLNDLASLEKLKFNLSSENVDKILETIGPVAKGISVNCQIANGKIAMMLKSMIPQNMTTRDVLSICGPDGLPVETFDFDPDSLVPSHMPEESLLREQKKPSESSKQMRAKSFADQLKVVSVPSSLLNVTQMQDQLKWLNLFQRGAKIPFCEVAKRLGIENYGETPGKNLYEKWKNEQLDELHFKAEAMKLAAVEMPHQEDSGGKGQGKGGGRPPTAQKAPHLEKRGGKSGNQRTVVSQSK